MVVVSGVTVFDDLRRLSRIAGFDDHLYIREIRQGVYRGVDDGRSPDAEKQRRHHHRSGWPPSGG